MTLDEKMEILNIHPVTNEMVDEVLNEEPLLEQQISKYKFYKMFGEITMFYSAEYLNETPIETLKESSQKYELIFNQK
jgi:hypothetical protein